MSRTEYNCLDSIWPGKIIGKLSFFLVLGFISFKMAQDSINIFNCRILKMLTHLSLNLIKMSIVLFFQTIYYLVTSPISCTSEVYFFGTQYKTSYSPQLIFILLNRVQWINLLRSFWNMTVSTNILDNVSSFVSFANLKNILYMYFSESITKALTNTGQRQIPQLIPVNTELLMVPLESGHSTNSKSI